jgi:hypothetical protein
MGVLPQTGAHQMGCGVRTARFKGAAMRFVATLENFRRILIRIRRTDGPPFPAADECPLPEIDAATGVRDD